METTPLGPDRIPLKIERGLDGPEFSLLCTGVFPREMEDRWFVFYQEPWLYIFRSWTGLGIYEVRFETAGPPAARE